MSESQRSHPPANASAQTTTRPVGRVTHPNSSRLLGVCAPSRWRSFAFFLSKEGEISRSDRPRCADSLNDWGRSVRIAPKRDIPNRNGSEKQNGRQRNDMVTEPSRRVVAFLFEMHRHTKNSEGAALPTLLLKTTGLKASTPRTLFRIKKELDLG